VCEREREGEKIIFTTALKWCKVAPGVCVYVCVCMRERKREREKERELLLHVTLQQYDAATDVSVRECERKRERVLSIPLVLP